MGTKQDQKSEAEATIRNVDPRILRTQNEVLDAAVEILLKEGVHAISHTRLWEISGVSRTTIYRHWPSRSALLSDVILRLARDLRIDDRLEQTDVGIDIHSPRFIRMWCALLEIAELDEDLDETRKEVGRMLVERCAPGMPWPDAVRKTATSIGPHIFVRLFLGLRPNR